MRCSKRLLSIFIIAFAARSAFAQTSTTLTVAKVQDFKQTGTAAPVQITNPFTLTATVQASGYTITTASVTPPGGGSTIPLTSVSSTLYTFTSGAFASATALNATFANNAPYAFNITGSAGPISNTVTMPATDDYPPAPTLANAEWVAGTLQFDPTQNFTISWQSGANVADIRLTVTNPNGVTVFTTTVSNTATSQAIPANTLQPGVIYDARLVFGRTVINQNGAVTSRAAFQSATNFSLNPVTGPPNLITPSGFTVIQGQPMAYQLVTNTNTTYNIDQTTLDQLGLKFDAATGIIYGIPTATKTIFPSYGIQNMAGANGGTITADSRAPGSAPTFANATSATGRAGVPFTFQIVTRGASRNASFSATNLPAGLSINTTTGLISGTTNTVGSSAANITVTDGSVSQTSTLQLTFVSDPIVPVITSAKRVTLYPGQSVAYQITAAFGSDRADEPSFKVIGTLPTGLNFDPKTGVISGTFGGQLQRNGGTPDQKFLNDSPLVQLAGTNAHGTGTSPLVFLAAPTGTVNLSTRMFVGTNDDVLIGGFIITGNAPENVLLRAIGPSLPVNGALQDPVLELHDASTTIAASDNWQDDAAQAQAVKDTGVPPTDNREGALVATFQPANFTAIVRGKNTATGVGLVELFDLGTVTQDTTQRAKLAQISTRGTVRTGDDVMIGGFIVQGLSTRVLLRGIGPELTAKGVAGALQDTILELHGADGTLIASNDDWRSNQAQDIINTGVAPTDERESALIESLNPGSYTAVLRGKSDTTGVALVEVYNLQ